MLAAERSGNVTDDDSPAYLALFGLVYDVIRADGSR